MTYQVVLTDSAKKQLEELPLDVQREVKNALLALQDNPRPRGCKKLKGKYAGYYRIRVGRIRVIYLVEDARLLVTVVWIGQRGGAYG